jgi:predicted CopG family antitoxin
MGKTTIQINLETLERLKSLKNMARQSYDEVLNNLLDNCEEESLSDDEIEDIKLALENVKRGKVKPIEQIAKELGITLT